MTRARSEGPAHSFYKRRPAAAAGMAAKNASEVAVNVLDADVLHTIVLAAVASALAVDAVILSVVFVLLRVGVDAAGHGFAAVAADAAVVFLPACAGVVVPVYN